MEDISLRKLNEIRISKLKDYLDFLEKEWKNNLPLDKFMMKKSMIETLKEWKGVINYEKEQALCILQVLEDCTDVIAKEIEAGLKPNSLLIDYMKERLEGVLEYKGE